jgi:hypothetical protein
VQARSPEPVVVAEIVLSLSSSGHPDHYPRPRLTYKMNGKTMSESFATPAAQRKAEREIETFRRYRQIGGIFR